MFDTISIGSATVDVFVRSSELKLLKTDEVFTGKAIIAPYGAKCEVDELVVQSGGGGTNTAVGFSRLGLKAAVLARCGQDFAGSIVKTELEKEKVDDSLLIQKRGDETDYSTILIGPDGGRTILVYRGETRLEADLIDWDSLSARWIYVSSIEGNLGLLKRLVSFCHQKKTKIAVNPGRKELAQKEKLTPILNQADVVIVNQEEAARLTNLPIDSPEIFPAMADLVKELAVVTRGEQGAVVYDREERKLVSGGYKVKAKDSTGAGDGFGCGLIAGLAKGWEIKRALKLGISNGASAVTEIGAKTGLLREENIDQWLGKKLKIEWRV